MIRWNHTERKFEGNMNEIDHDRERKAARSLAQDIEASTVNDTRIVGIRLESAAGEVLEFWHRVEPDGPGQTFRTPPCMTISANGRPLWSQAIGIAEAEHMAAWLEAQARDWRQWARERR